MRTWQMNVVESCWLGRYGICAHSVPKRWRRLRFGSVVRVLQMFVVKCYVVYLPSTYPSLDVQQITNSSRYGPLSIRVSMFEYVRPAWYRPPASRYEIDTVRSLDRTCLSESYLRYQGRYQCSVLKLVSNLDLTNLLSFCFGYCSPLLQWDCNRCNKSSKLKTPMESGYLPLVGINTEPGATFLGS